MENFKPLPPTLTPPPSLPSPPPLPPSPPPPPPPTSPPSRVRGLVSNTFITHTPRLHNLLCDPRSVANLVTGYPRPVPALYYSLQIVNTVFQRWLDLSLPQRAYVYNENKLRGLLVEIIYQYLTITISCNSQAVVIT